MSVFRIHKTDNYTVMSNTHFKEKEMSLKAKGLLSLMLSLPDTWNYSVTGLVKLSKDGKDSVMSALGELENFGYLTRTQVVNDKGQFAGIEYNIFEEPQAEKPISENRISAKQHAEKSNSEKPPQLSTKESNTNSINKLNVSNTKKEKEINDVLVSAVHDEELFELYKDYIEMRKEMEAPLNAKGLQMLIKRCERLSKNNVRVQRLLLENSLLNGWKNVFLPTESELELASQETQEDLRSLFGLEQDIYIGFAVKVAQKSFQACLNGRLDRNRKLYINKNYI